MDTTMGICAVQIQLLIKVVVRLLLHHPLFLPRILNHNWTQKAWPALQPQGSCPMAESGQRVQGIKLTRGPTLLDTSIVQRQMNRGAIIMAVALITTVTVHMTEIDEEIRAMMMMMKVMKDKEDQTPGERNLYRSVQRTWIPLTSWTSLDFLWG